jgi:hypothetical protein
VTSEDDAIVAVVFSSPNVQVISDTFDQKLPMKTRLVPPK